MKRNWIYGDDNSRFSYVKSSPKWKEKVIHFGERIKNKWLEGKILSIVQFLLLF